MVQYYKVAGLVLEMDTFGRTLEQAKPYLCEKAEPQIIMKSNAEDFHSQHPHFSMDDCEYMSTSSFFYRNLLRHSGFMLHSSAVVVDGKAYLFSAASGTGKSTHTQLWLKQFGERAYMLNDDKPALRMEDGQWYAYGTPWSGKYDYSTNARVPVGGICFLKRGEKNVIRPYGGSKAVFSFLEQTLRPGMTEVRMEIMALLGKLLESVKVWELECNMDPEAALVSYRAMSGEDA